jgi:HK97 gp10 family phage protein
MEVIGGRELIAKMDALQKKDVFAAIRKGTRTGCKMLADKVRSMTPQRTGTLSQSVKVRALKRKKGVIGHQVVVAVKRDRAYVNYSGFVEFGLTHRVYQGRHFTKRAVRGTDKEALATVIDALVEEIGRRISSAAS